MAWPGAHRADRRFRQPGACLALLLGLSLAACLPGDLSLQGKRCDSERICPGDMVCVQTPDTILTRMGICYRAQDAPTCESGQTRCGPEGLWLEVCDADGRSHSVMTDCQGDDLLCSPDTLACARTCQQDEECPSGEVCNGTTGLCRPYPACPEPSCPDLCIQGACVPAAEADASSSSGLPDLDCYLEDPSAPPAQPATCELTGRVNIFPAKSNSDQAIGLIAVLREAASPYALVDFMSVFEGADGAGYYSFADVPTNRRYLVEIEAGTSQAGEVVVSTINAGGAVRADQCLAGVVTRGVSAVRRADYETFSGGTVDGLSAGMGLLIGRALDCDEASRRPLGNIRVGLAFAPPSPGRIYYFADEDFLFPDLGLGATTVRGYYAAAGLSASRNTVGFAARQGSTNLLLGAVEFFCGPDQAVIADLPLPSERLPD